jgi:hypothetical protein
MTDGGVPALPIADGGAAAGEPPSAEAGQGGAAEAVPAPGLSLSALTLLQTLEVPLMNGGSELLPDARTLPVVAGKSSVFRAYFELAPGFVPRHLLGVLDLKIGGTTHSLVSELSPDTSSSAAELSTTFTFRVDPADVTPASSYRVRVLEADTSPLARFPEAGYADLGARAMDPLEVVLVPFVANGFTPRTGSAEVEALRRRLLALYPLSDVELSLAEPVSLNYVVNGDGDGWDPALNQIYALRDAASPPQNVFYFGMLAPDTSYDAYCANGCILGYSNVADPDDVDSRGSIGVTVFPDGSGATDAWDTVAHELGHALGRDHAPCHVDVSDTDPSWPDDTAHHNAAIGVYGYDFELLQLLKPRQYRDVMSYCTPQWISDYTYQGIFERLAHIQAQAFRAHELVAPELFRLARVGRHGDSAWLGQRIKRGAAAHQLFALLDARGRQLGTIDAQVARVDHAPGGFVWLPERALVASGAASVDLRPLGGSVLAL